MILEIIQETMLIHFVGEPCEIYHCVLESKSFLEKMSVVEHTIPFFLPIREAENDLLSSDAKVCLLLFLFPHVFFSSLLIVVTKSSGRNS